MVILMLRHPMDHDIVEDINNRIYVVVGNQHPPNGLIAYLKYIPGNGAGIWVRQGMPFKRVLKAYGVKSLHTYLPRHQEFVYDPVLNSYVPMVNKSSILKYYYPEIRLHEILSRVDDELEFSVIEFIDILRKHSRLSVNDLGITGSLLTKTHNVNVSDVDMVIYGCNNALEFMDCVSYFDKAKLTYEDLVKQSNTYGLDVDTLARINPPYKRILVRGKEVNVIFVDNSPPPRYGSRIYVNLGVMEVVAEVIGGNCRSLMYPSIAEVSRIKDVILGDSSLARLIKYVVSYEGLYSYQLFLGGNLRIRGLIQMVIPDHEYQLLVGGIEEPGYVIPRD